MEAFDIIVIIIVGLFTGFYGTISGGGALLTIPALIFVGLPPQIAVATNRFAWLGIGTTGIYRFAKDKKVLFNIGWPLAIFAAAGSLIGATLLLQIQEDLLQKIIAILLILIAIVAIIKKDLDFSKIKFKPSKNKKIIGYILSFVVGLYGGFFGAAWATFFTCILIFCFGLTFLESAGTRKIAGMAYSLVAIAIFIYFGKIHFIYAILLFITQGIGSYLGASYAIHKGENFAKIIFIIVAIISGIKLLIS